MNTRDLLAELAAACIRLSIEGDNLRVRGEPGVILAPYLDRIREHKPALMAELLKVRIIAVVTVPPEHFDRDEYDRRWSQLRDLENAP